LLGRYEENQETAVRIFTIYLRIIGIRSRSERAPPRYVTSNTASANFFGPRGYFMPVVQIEYTNLFISIPEHKM
jgi:hypothetical protein